MSVKVIFECSGCEAKIEGTAPLRARFESMYGGNLCRIIKPTAEDVVPEGWVAYDPYTLATYCPECCDLIWPPEEPVTNYEALREDPMAYTRGIPLDAEEWLVEHEEAIESFGPGELNAL